jgi:hypothetical protein
MWKEMVQIQAASGLPTVTTMDRTKRQQQTYGAEPHYSGAAPGVNGNPQGGSCCTCQVGPPGKFQGINSVAAAVTENE